MYIGSAAFVGTDLHSAYAKNSTRSKRTAAHRALVSRQNRLQVGVKARFITNTQARARHESGHKGPAVSLLATRAQRLASRYLAVACASDAPPMQSIVLLTLFLLARIAQGLIEADLLVTTLATFLCVKGIKAALAVFFSDDGVFLTRRIIQAVTPTFAGRTILALAHSLPVTVRMIVAALVGWRRLFHGGLLSRRLLHGGSRLIGRRRRALGSMPRWHRRPRCR